MDALLFFHYKKQALRKVDHGILQINGSPYDTHKIDFCAFTAARDDRILFRMMLCLHKVINCIRQILANLKKETILEKYQRL